MSFFKVFFASLLAFMVAGALGMIFFVMVLAGAATLLGNRAGMTDTKPNSVLLLDLSQGVVDEPDNSLFKKISFGGITTNNSNSIFEVISAIENAELDKNIRGIYINVTEGGSISTANVEEVRGALERFRERSGKFIVAYADSYSQTGYYLSSVADRVFLNPQGMVAWHGLSSNVLFFKGLLDKLGVKVEVVRHGAYKSAVEPFTLERMSPESRAQLDALLGSVWRGMVMADVAASRGEVLAREVTVDGLAIFADRLVVENADLAVSTGLVDKLLYEDEVLDLLARLAGQTGAGAASVDRELANLLNENVEDVYNIEDVATAGSDETDDTTENISATDEGISAQSPKNPADPNLISIGDYIAATQSRSGSATSGLGERIAIVYIDGDIVEGESSQGSAGSATVTQRLRKARRDDAVKGVVVRINSPGGSALASEVIWREMDLLCTQKPVVVSMGGYAASGGYYVAAPANAIVADRSTITGSIGVFGLLVNIEPTLRTKLGITVDVAKTGEYADMGSPLRPLRDAERRVLMRSIEQTYGAFVDRVASGRGVTAGEVEAVASGRVWSGVNAVEIGLVDRIGGLRDAIDLCAEMAEIADKDFRVVELVDEPDALSSLLRAFSSAEAREMRGLHAELGEAFVYYNTLTRMLDRQGSVQARMPFMVEMR